MKKLFTISLLITISALKSYAQNYFLGTTADGIEEVYIMSVTANRSNSTVVVFDRVKPAEGKLADFRHSAIKAANKDKVDIDKLEKLGYYRRKIQFVCTTKKYRVMECTYYDMGGKVLDEIKNDEDDVAWSAVHAGTMTEAEMKKACR